MKTKESKRIYEVIKFKVSYLCIETGLIEYLAEEPLNVIKAHESMVIPSEKNEWLEIFRIAIIDFWRISSYIHKAKSLIFEATAYHLKIYQLAQAINNQIQGDDSKSTQDFIRRHTEYLKRNSNPTLFKYPSEYFNIINRYVNFVASKLTSYLTLKKAIYLYLEYYQLDDIFDNAKSFDNWEEAYKNDFWYNVFLYDDSSEFGLMIPRFEDVPQINKKEYDLICESLITDLREFEKKRSN